MNKNNLVAILVLNHNKKNDVLVCLNSLYKQNYKNFEVVVVDNGSSDGSIEAIRKCFPNVHLVESRTNLGVAGGRNLGIKYILSYFNCHFIFFLDNDIVIDSNTLTEMVNSFYSKESIGIVTPKCYMMDKQKVFAYAGGMNVNLFTGSITNIGGGQIDKGQFDKSEFINSCGGLCLVSKTMINQVGIFDENFNPYGWEDVDLSIRAKRQGFKIFYNHKAVIYHKGGKSGRGALKEYELSKVKNYIYLIKKHANILQLFTIALFFPVRIIPAIAKELLKGEFLIIFSQVRGILSFYKTR